MFTNAIVRKPGESIIDGVTSANSGVPNYAKALEQHRGYVNALKNCGLKLLVLDACEDYPDSVFVEDTALITPHCAIMMRPGERSRRGEVDIMRAAVCSFHLKVHDIISPGTIEAGDIMMVGSHYYIGLSARTNLQGADQLIKILGSYNMNGSPVKMNHFLHLKTGLSYLEKNNLLVAGEFVGRKEFSQYVQIIVEPDDEAAANSVWINGKVLMPSGHPRVRKQILASDYDLIELDMSEYQKLDGGLSCLSLRF